MRRVGLWCRKGHVIEPGDDDAQCEPVGVAYVEDASFTYDWDRGWVMDGVVTQ